MLFVLLLLFLASGCANSKFQRAETARRAQTEMIGMSKKDLFLCAGVPMRQERVEDLEFLTYSGGGDSVGVGVATTTSSSTAVGVSTRQHRYCEVTFILKDGKVMKINYSGRTGGFATKGEQCAFVVENCLSTQESSTN